MFEYNDGTGESNILQNQFTAYLMKAIRNSKIGYLRRQTRLQQYEIAVELQDHFHECQIETDFFSSFPIIEQIENIKLQQALTQQKERDLYIFLSRALNDRSIAEIAQELDMGYKAVAAVYYRMIANLKKELGGETE